MIDDQVVEQENQQVETTPESQEQPQEQVTEEVSTPKVETKRKDAEYNFAELRRQREDDRRRAEEAERRSNELLELLKRAQGNNQQEQRDLIGEELGKLSKDDLATIDNVDKKIDRKFSKKEKEVDEVRKELAALRSQIEEQKFRSKYPDLDEVISSENIELLKKEDPEIAQMISDLPTGSRQQVLMAYKYIKKIVPMKAPESDDKKRALENSKKPLSVQSLRSTSAMGNAQVFEDRKITKEVAERYRKQMEEAMKG